MITPAKAPCIKSSHKNMLIIGKVSETMFFTFSCFVNIDAIWYLKMNMIVQKVVATGMVKNKVALAKVLAI